MVVFILIVSLKGEESTQVHPMAERAGEGRQEGVLLTCVDQESVSLSADWLLESLGRGTGVVGTISKSPVRAST